MPKGNKEALATAAAMNVEADRIVAESGVIDRAAKALVNDARKRHAAVANLAKNAGLRVIDVIDYSWLTPTGESYHHTTLDTIDRLSEKSLQIVGDVAVRLLRGS